MRRSIAFVAFAVSWIAVLPHGIAAQPRYRIEYSTCLGGSEWDQAREVIPAADGTVLIGMQSNSTGMPVSATAFQKTYAGDDPSLGSGGIYGGDNFLARFSPDAKRVVAATYFGGSKQERNTYGMLYDSQGNIVICTGCRSPDLPTTPGAFQRTFGGGPSDMMVAKLSGDLSRLIWCTYVGGSDDEFPRGGIAIGSDDSVYVVGETRSPNFPTTPGVLQRTRKGTNDAAIVRLKADGSGLIFSTLLGGGATEGSMGIQVDAKGYMYLGGHTTSADFPVTAGAAQAKLGGQSDAWLAKIVPDATGLVWATYLGGSGDEFAEHRIWLDADGSVILAGFTGSTDFPTANAWQGSSAKGNSEGFLTHLSADGKAFLFSTYLGGSGSGDFTIMPIRDAQGNILVGGQTGSTDLPTTPDALQPAYGGGAHDGFIAMFSPDGSKLLYLSYVGGNDEDMVRSVAAGPAGEVYVVGETFSPDFPTTAGAFQTKAVAKGDAYLMKLVPTAPPVGVRFRRADPNADGFMDISDPICSLFYQFLGMMIPCEKSADLDGDGTVNVADVLHELRFLFQEGPPPEEPFSSCDLETAPTVLACGSFPPCL